MANARRGEIDVSIAGQRLRLCLTLGALAEIETALGAAGLQALGQRLTQGDLAARDLIAIIGAAARGGGETVSETDIAQWTCADAIEDMAAAVTRLFAAAFLRGDANPNP
ncbi:MAG: gene transfer agent family protein [Beijerinckiaceae bacterium]